MTRVAVIVSGQVRAAATCAPVFPYRGLHGEYVYLHFPFGTSVPERWGVAASNHRRFLDPTMPERPEYEAQRGRGCAGVQQVLRQLRGLAFAWQDFCATAFLSDYDIIVRARPDALFYVPPETAAEMTPDGALHVPRFANWWGLNDRFAWGTPDVMERYFTRLSRLDEYIDAGGVFHAETFLAWCMEGVSIKRSRAVFASVRDDGTRDEPVYVPVAGDELPC
jgi:hypothetical protein